MGTADCRDDFSRLADSESRVPKAGVDGHRVQELCIIQPLTLNMKNERLELEHCIPTGASESRYQVICRALVMGDEQPDTILLLDLTAFQRRVSEDDSARAGAGGEELLPAVDQRHDVFDVFVHAAFLTLVQLVQTLFLPLAELFLHRCFCFIHLLTKSSSVQQVVEGLDIHPMT